jgi:hypothetical protein
MPATQPSTELDDTRHDSVPAACEGLLMKHYEIQSRVPSDDMCPSSRAEGARTVPVVAGYKMDHCHRQPTQPQMLNSCSSSHQLSKTAAEPLPRSTRHHSVRITPGVKLTSGRSLITSCDASSLTCQQVLDGSEWTAGPPWSGTYESDTGQLQ